MTRNEPKINDDFPGHPYRVLDDEDMQNLMESIKDRGVITPAMLKQVF